jgi:hypothetical protein
MSAMSKTMPGDGVGAEALTVFGPIRSVTFQIFSLRWRHMRIDFKQSENLSQI